MTAPSTIVVTGCTGRIGKSIFNRFKDSSYQLVGLDVVPPPELPKNGEFILMDITSLESIQNAFKEIQQKYGNKLASVIHLAAYYNFEGGDWSQYEKITLQGTEDLFDILQNYEVEQFIYSSTMLVHAPCNPPGKINEDSPLLGSWEYPQSKIEAELIVHEKHGNIPYVILRIAGCYDDECHSIPIANQIQRIYENQFISRLFPGNENHGASFLHLDDLAEAIWLTVQKRKELPHELTLLVGEEKVMSYGDLQRLISRLLKNREMITYQIPKPLAKTVAWGMNAFPLMGQQFVKPWMIDLADDHYDLNLTQIRKYLGWKEKHTLKDTIPAMIRNLEADPLKWYQTNKLTPPSWLKKRKGD